MERCKADLKSFVKYNNPEELFTVAPRLENSQKHWDEAWNYKSDCFDLLLLSDKSWLDETLTESANAVLTYVNSDSGQLAKKAFTVKVALLRKDKKECGRFGHPNTIFR